MEKTKRRSRLKKVLYWHEHYILTILLESKRKCLLPITCKGLWICVVDIKNQMQRKLWKTDHDYPYSTSIISTFSISLFFRQFNEHITFMIFRPEYEIK